MLRLFFNMRIVSKSPAEISMPISTLLELHSCANLACLVNLALCLFLLSQWKLGMHQYKKKKKLQVNLGILK